MHVIMLTIAVLYIYRYAEKVRKDPFRGFFGEKSQEVELPKDGSQIIFEKKQKLVLAAFVANIAVIVVGAIRFEWYLGEMSACFVILSIVVAVIAKMGVEGYVNHFLQGAASLISGALIIGLAKAITVVLSEGNILDTILNGAASLLQNFPIAFVIIGMFFVQELIHFLVPSSSGQAMLTIPIMMPIADLLGITRQTTCFVFTLADGVGSIFWPTSGYFMAALGVYHVPYQVWLKKMFPLILIEYCVGMIASIIAANLHYGPF